MTVVGIYSVKRLVISAEVGDWCRFAYPRHPRGCPNYEDPKHAHCPPHAPAISAFFDLERQLYLAHSTFDLEAWAAKMKAKYPRWTDAQCRNVLYWQRGSRNQIKDWLRNGMNTGGRLIKYTLCPEGMGANVYATACLAWLKLEKIDGLRICRHVALFQYLGR